MTNIGIHIKDPDLRQELVTENNNRAIAYRAYEIYPSFDLCNQKSRT